MQSVRKILRRSKPLHKQVSNLYKQNLSLRAHKRALLEENETLTKELEMVKSKLSKKNLKQLQLPSKGLISVDVHCGLRFCLFDIIKQI